MPFTATGIASQLRESFSGRKTKYSIRYWYRCISDNIRSSYILSGNDTGRLANVQEMPFIDPAYDDDHLKQIIQYYNLNPDEMEKELHVYAKSLLEQSKAKEAWQILLATS